MPAGGGNASLNDGNPTVRDSSVSSCDGNASLGGVRYSFDSHFNHQGDQKAAKCTGQCIFKSVECTKVTGA